MKLHGYNSKSKKYVETDEVTIQANPAELRRIAAFILNSAKLMEKYKEFSHEHLQDFERNELPRKPDIIISRLEEK